MKKRNMRLLSVILSLILVFQVMPAGVFANEISEEEMATVIEEVTETAAEVELVDDETVEEENNEEMIAEVSEEASEENIIVEEEASAIEETAQVEEETETAEENAQAEEIAQVEEETEAVEEENTAAEETEETEETEEVSWASYTLYNYISLNEGKTYISLNTQENGISAPKSAAEFHKDNGYNRYDLLTSEYEIAGYDLTQLVVTTAGYSFVEQSVAKEGQPYFIARLDRVEAVAAANFRPSDCVQGIESFTSLNNGHITFHRNWYLTLVTPMTSNKLLTGVRLGDGKNGNGDGKYYGLEYTENFQAVDSRLLPFSTKLRADQYSIADYDFTDLTLTYKGVAYAYRPNGPVAGDGEAFHYYTVSFMKIDKLNKSTYGGGYLTENWPAWALINSSAAGKDGYPYLAGYYHRDYQATLMVGDAPAVVEEEPIVEEIAPVVEEEPIVEEIAAVVEEEPIVEEIAEVIEEEAVVEEIAEVIEEEAVVEEIAEVIEEEAIIEEIAVIEEAPAAAEIAETYSDSYAPVVRPAAVNEQEVAENAQQAAPQAKPIVQVIEETVLPMAAAPAAATREWALMNLISMIAVAFISLVMAITFFCKDEEEENNVDNTQKNWSKFLGIFPAAVSIIAFALTEDMNTLMVLTDKWTAFMAIIVLVDLALAYLSRNGKKEEIA
ncbi:MAG: hypothetical protein IKG47_08735 [Oscillospiraceae bacterium]|nr:hypothetical protein [Oscillospiraceae bacterium]